MQRSYALPERKPYVPQPCAHPYADCSTCGGSGLARSVFSPVLDACQWCVRRYEAACAKHGAAKADAQRRILAIEAQLGNSWELPKELKAHTVGRKPKPLSAAGAAALEAHFLSDLNREYLACLKVFWA